MRLVIASVKYADCLAIALPAWLAVVPAHVLTVATSPEDHESRQVAFAHGVTCVVTDAWTRTDPDCHVGRDATFNLALGLDEALGLVPSDVRPPAHGELVGHVSADCVPFGAWPAEKAFKADTIYGFWRHECLTPRGLAGHMKGTIPLTQFPKLKNSHGWPIGYNQLFRYQGQRFGSYPTAGKFDTDFSRGFLHREMRSELYFLHLGPISVRENWAGRVIPTWGTA